MTPARLQLSRRKGFNLQEHSRAVNGLNAVNVARPSKWGNPFRIGEPGVPNAEVAVTEFRYLLAPHPPHIIPLYMTHEDIVTELRGKNLACWCGDGPCHADVLLDLANRPTCEGVEP